MRGPLLLFTALLLLVPVASSLSLGPEQWSATGAADWGQDVWSTSNHGGSGDGAAPRCFGELRTGAVGPMRLGPHKGEYRVWVEADSADDACDLTRSGWIRSPHVDGNHMLRDEGTSGTMITFETNVTGERLFFLTEWDETDPEAPYLFTLGSEIREESRRFVEAS